MAVDEAVVRAIEQREAIPTIRVFGWDPPAVSFGYAQRIQREIDPEKCRHEGIDIVRRASGGRAVLHWNELTYSILCAADDPLLGGSIKESYRKISACLVAGIRSLGIDARFEPAHRKVPGPRADTLTSPCFSTTTQYEITVQGKKLVGSAQRRLGDMLLQHGSFLLGPEHRKIVDLFPDTQQNLKQRFKKQLQEKTISLSETGSDLEFPEIAEAISRGFTDTLGLTLETGSLSSYEKQLTEHLVDTKYGTKDWNFRESEMDSTAICPLA
jgi:lipoate-protein ligase A